MSLRYEHKYLVPERLLDAVRRRIEPFVELDSHVRSQARHAYTVRNIYFDDARFKSYFEKDDGIEVRAKLRIRAYDDHQADKFAFLEVKRRQGAIGSKDRAAIRFDHVAELLATGDVDRLVVPPPWLPDSRASARKFLFHLHRDALRPVLFEAYEREPYVGTMEPSLRVTLDRHVRSSVYPRSSDFFAVDGTRSSFRGSFILEVKHDTSFGFPSWLRGFIGEHGLVREALSKLLELHGRLARRAPGYAWPRAGIESMAAIVD